MKKDYSKETKGFIIVESSMEDAEFRIASEYEDRVIAEGVLQRANVENRNRRCYAREDLFREIHSPRTQELVRTGNFKGEAGHPSSTELSRQQKIDPQLEQVLYTKLWMEGDYVKAHFMGTNNALGESFDKDLRMGQKPSFSLRALGSINNKNGKSWVTNLRIITYDRVYYPSHKEAYTSKLISEGAELLEENFIFKTPDIVRENGNILEVEEGYQIITPVTNKNVIDYITQESTNLDTIIHNFDTIYNSIKLSEDGTRVTLVDENYDTIVVPLERHIQNELMDYFSKL